ncbi:augmin complex subunit dgt5 [Anopheles aquasalis]|uniref:augmin complex subunit dgt5 n=1 Tax=Anopheles aquasalis TaxID=42839 RepID=UPI00215A8FD9|nr:augmin complex subunit dgt5 [Anopheles aquasalis]
MDDITRFKQWASKMGCAPGSVPPDDTLKRAFRGDQSTMLKHIMQKVRPRQEISLMRKNVLVKKLQEHKQTDRIVLNSMLHRLPVELQRFEKIKKLKGKIEETRARLNTSKACVESIGLHIKEKNAVKLQMARCLEELHSKAALYTTHEVALKGSIEKEEQLADRLDRIMPARGFEPTSSAETPELAIERCIELLGQFYEHLKSSTKKEESWLLQEQLWASMREVLRGIPNHLLWGVLLKLKEDHLRQISEEDNRQAELERTGNTISDRDLVQVSKSKLYATHIGIFLDLATQRQLVSATKENYLAKYTSCTGELEAKMALLNEIDDEAEETLEEYLMQWNSRVYNQGQIVFLEAEIERKKQEIAVYDQKIQNHDQLLSQLRGIYARIDDISKHMEEELDLVRQIKQKVAYSKYVSQRTVHGLRQKGSNNNQTLNVSDQSMSRMDSTIIGTPVPTGSTYTPAILPVFVRELEVFRTLPYGLYGGQSKLVRYCLEPNPAVFCERSTADLTLLPSSATSADASLKQFGALVALEHHVNEATAESHVACELTIDQAELQQRWQGNHGRICELLDEIDLISNSIRQVLDKARSYYNFSIANSLRQFVPPTRLFNGRNYREYESEYMMYYRMINGFGGH